MQLLSILFQVIIAAGIVNVWMLRYDKPTPWRPDGASNMKEEFRRYGLPDWARTATRIAKLTLAALLIVGIWYPPLAVAGGLGMAVLMLGAIGAHFRIGDPLKKSLPAFTLLVLSLFVAYVNSGL